MNTNNDNVPHISIITVSYNSSSTIEETILSIINQTYSNIEYIIIDGGSTDGTIDIIKKYNDKITYWISEPDKGIYDAMNKGIKRATGEWINFMNCGDTFTDNTVIEKVFNLAKAESDVIYGNTNLIFSIGEYLEKGEKATPSKYMPFGHQSSFVRNSLMKEFSFDTRFKICADRNFFYIAYKNGSKFEYVDVDIANYEAEKGISSTNISQLYYETGIIEGKSNNLFWRIKYILYLLFYKIKNIVKRILPETYVKNIKRRNAEHRFIKK